MRLDFRILWIDDQQRHVDSFAEGLKYKLRDLGFELEVIRVERIDDLEEAIEEHVHNDGIDLVLVDYDLGSNSHAGGEDALTKVRKKFQYKEIIFYSATDVDNLRTIAYERKVDGVNFSTRLSLVDDATAVVNKLLNRVLDIDHMRGIVMAATSDIDALVEGSLLAVYSRLDEPKQLIFRNDIAAQLRKKLSDWQADLSNAEAKNSLEAIVKLRHLFSAADRLDRLLAELEAWTSDKSAHKDKALDYRNTIVPRRNKLAHTKVQSGSTPSGPFSLDDMTGLRCSLIEHRQNFHDIAVLVDVRF